MGGHALRGAVTAWMALIVLETVGDSKTAPSTVVGGLLGDLNNLLKRAIAQDVPAIPDRRPGHQKEKKEKPGYGVPTREQARAAARAAAGSDAVTAVTSPGGLLDNLDSLGQYANGGG
jgi:hypothetical protein